MKRNNMFMLSYIIFIFIALAAKLFLDYPMWLPLVTAITVASYFFACSDIFNIVSQEYETDVKSFTPLLNAALEKVARLEVIFQKNTSMLNEYKENGEYLAEVLLEGPGELDAVKKQLIAITNGIKLKHVISSCCKAVCNPLLVIGYLSFFCTITFEQLNAVLLPIQNHLTVIAFGLLLSTQFFMNYVREEHEKLIENYGSANSILENLIQTTNDALEYLGEKCRL